MSPSTRIVNPSTSESKWDPMTWRAISARPNCDVVDAGALKAAARPLARALHSFTFQLNVSDFCGAGGAFRCWVWGVAGGMRGY